MPVLTRSSSLATTSRRATGFAAAPGRACPRGGPRVSSTTSSCRVFQRWQEGHWPSHFGEEWPHSAQA
jgi:hypothetical protein